MQQEKIDSIMENITEDSNLCIVREALENHQFFSIEDLNVLLKALDLLIEKEEDSVDHGELIVKLKTYCSE